jgi:2-haloacid dehalogenase
MAELFPGKGSALAQLWRAKQLQYTLLRSMMGRDRNFSSLTQDGLIYASKSPNLDVTPEEQERLMEEYTHLAVFPDVEPGLTA